VLTDTIPTPGWWLCGLIDRRATPAYWPEVLSEVLSDGSHRAMIDGLPIQGYTNDPAAVLEWVREGKLP